jgi:hypothetical protein
MRKRAASSDQWAWWCRRPAALLGASGLGLFLVLGSAEHVVHPSLNPLRYQISEYATTRDGWVMGIGFGAWALSLAATATLVRSVARLAALGCGCAAIGILLVTIFQTQTSAGALPAGIARSATGRLHDLGGSIATAGVALAVVGTAASAGFSRQTRLVAVAAASSALIASAVFLLLDATPGLRQRLVLLAGCVWQAAVLRAQSRGR